jgi:hypothetical protein
VTQLLEGLANGAIRNGLGVEYVTGNQDGIDFLLGSDLCQMPHGFKTLIAEGRTVIPWDPSEALADLPVGGVQNAYAHN